MRGKWPHSIAASAGNLGRSRIGVRGLGIAVLGAGLSWSVSAAAEPTRAEALFREGRRLLAEGQLAAACDKFAESQREQPCDPPRRGCRLRYNSAVRMA